MPITQESYQRLANHLCEVLNERDVQRIVSGDFLPLRQVIVEELMFMDYQGAILDIVFEDLFSQKKKPILRAELEGFAEFLMSDLSLFLIQHYLSKRLKK